MDYYHGSIIPHLTELRPFEGKENNLKRPCVYLTTNPQLAIHYIRDKSRLWISPTLDVREDGVLVYQEMFSNALEYMYKGVSGYVYRVSGDYGIDTVPGVRFAAVSDEPVPIIDSEFIPDVYDEILSFADNSKFIYEHYEDLPQWRHDKIREWVLKWIKDGDWISKPQEPMARFYKEKWPEYWLEAVRARRET
jgi:hypothetical protein